MNDEFDRREFVKRCTAACAALIAPFPLSYLTVEGFPAGRYEICSVTGDGYFENTMKAVEGLGGIGKFVGKGGTVGLLINSPFEHAGTFTNPDIPLAIMKLCFDAGAKQVSTIHPASTRYWQKGSMYRKLTTEIACLKHSDDKREVAIARGKSLKTAEISETLLSCDTYINMPIVKDHEGTRYTGNLKNVMGACSSSTCRFFHYGGKFPLFSGAYSNIELLSQCIADVNLVRRPDLCIVDATEFVTSNGPGGPGDMKKPREIIASNDCVAADMFAIRHLGLDPEELPLFRSAREHGYGPASLKEVHIKTL